MSKRKVLLLNQGETVLDVITWQQAVCLLVKGNAKVPFGYEEHYKIPVSVHAAENIIAEKKFEAIVEKDEEGLARGYFLLPTALVLVEYVHIPYRRAAVTKKNVLKRDNYTCGYCKKELTHTSGTIDHIIPQSRWVEFKRKKQIPCKHVNGWKNVVASCRKCNVKKDNKTPEEAGMKLKTKPFVPSKDYLIFTTIDIKTAKTWNRWLCFDDLK
jgi:5-methylcytosine-specific restriction endonuclease McrA